MNYLIMLLGLIALLPSIACGELAMEETHKLIDTYEDNRKYNEVCWLRNAHEIASNF